MRKKCRKNARVAFSIIFPTWPISRPRTYQINVKCAELFDCSNMSMFTSYFGVFEKNWMIRMMILLSSILLLSIPLSIYALHFAIYLLTATIEYLTISFWFPSKILIQVKNCILYDFDFQVAEQSCIQICQRKIDSKLLPWDFLHNFLPEDPKIKLAPRPFMEKYTWMSGDAWPIYRLAHTNL